jgi:hypothetical protein
MFLFNNPHNPRPILHGEYFPIKNNNMKNHYYYEVRAVNFEIIEF